MRGRSVRLRIVTARVQAQAATSTISNACTWRYVLTLRGGRADAPLRIERVWRVGILPDDLAQRFTRLFAVPLRVVGVGEKREDGVGWQHLILRLQQLGVELVD